MTEASKGLLMSGHLEASMQYRIASNVHFNVITMIYGGFRRELPPNKLGGFLFHGIGLHQCIWCNGLLLHRPKFRRFPPYLSSPREDVERRVMIPVHHKPTEWALVDSIGQGFLHPFPASRTLLSRTPRVHPDKLPTGSFLLVGYHPDEPAPPSIANRLGERAHYFM